MAQQINTSIVSDFSGKPGATISYSHNGVSYEIDLDPLEARNFERMRQAFNEKMQAYLDVSRRVGGRASRNYDPSKVREWAADNGYEISARGRLSDALIDAYMAR